MQKIIAIILLCFILIWTYNLFIDNIITLEEVEEEPYRGIIRLWDVSRTDVNTGSMYPWLQDKIRAFERRNPGVYIEFVKTDWDSIYNAINGKSEGDERPDIIPVDSNFFDFNMLESLDEYIDDKEVEEFKHQVIKSTIYKEQLVAIPVAMSTNVLYINLDMFHERGISPPLSGDWTYGEFVDILKKLNYDSDDDGIIDKYGFITNIDENCYNIWGIILSDGAELINPKRLEYNFYGEKAIKGLKRVVDLRKEHKVVPDYFGVISEKDAWEMFYKDQKVAAFITEAWAVDYLDERYKSGEGFNFDVVNFPKGDKNLPVILSDDIVSYGIVKDEHIKKTKMCAKFLKYLTTESNQRSLEEMGLFTVKRGIDDMYKDNLKMKKIENSLMYTEYIPFIDNKVEIDTIIQQEIRKAVLNQKSSVDAIEDAKTKINKLINKN
ncbi:extracellular solute-binding protein [Schnuerera sp. xch1]|uniref:extracellular solute-binding protein n=1 Tax=Schnuerera sp. xch1 TaxID=2874283 RepID=UPI001CC16DC1|nr:extracellular solute-binding protein [Schnuerera sp. xch1]MBZ2175911.1 extracellular solute-binding protein [Schnuerera sp. xch1]